MQDEIVTHLARAMDIQLSEVEAARLTRTPAANPDAEDLALRCAAGAQAVLRKGRLIGKDADDAGYRLCEEALAADPNNVRALAWLSYKFVNPVMWGLSVDPSGDLKRADELTSKALALDPNYAKAHAAKARALTAQGRLDESIAEYERALTLDPALMDSLGSLGWDYLYSGRFEKMLEYFDKGIRLSPHDPFLSNFYHGEAAGYFALKQVRSDDRMGAPGDCDRSEHQCVVAPQPHPGARVERS
jgi:tetratricopeptide (TPR) repeat protein